MDAAQRLDSSELGCYGNIPNDETVHTEVERLTDNAHLFGCNTVPVFAGALLGVSVLDSVPESKRCLGN